MKVIDTLATMPPTTAPVDEWCDEVIPELEGVATEAELLAPTVVVMEMCAVTEMDEELAYSVECDNVGDVDKNCEYVLGLNGVEAICCELE